MAVLVCKFEFGEEIFYLADSMSAQRVAHYESGDVYAVAFLGFGVSPNNNSGICGE